MKIDQDALVVVNNRDHNRYEIEAEGELAKAEYVRAGDTVTFTSTQVPRALEGQGIAGRLAKFALDDARAQGLRVIPRCPYFASYIERHPEYADLVDRQ